MGMKTHRNDICTCGRFKECDDAQCDECAERFGQKDDDLGTIDHSSCGEMLSFESEITMTKEENLERINGIILKECFPKLKKDFIGRKINAEFIDHVRHMMMRVLSGHENAGEITLDGVDFMFAPEHDGTLLLCAVDHEEFKDVKAIESKDDGYKN